MSEYKCNLIIAGVGKSGTSSLHSYLETHPKICMSDPKEPHFFSIDAVWKSGVSYHNGLFPGKAGATVFGESSTTYFSSEIAMRRIKNELHNPKVIVVLRDPVGRVISHYRWVYSLGLEKRPFLQAIKESGYDFDPNVSIEGRCYMSYLEFSLYSKWVPKLQEVFGAENLLILRADDLKDHPDLVVDRCCEFLGVEKVDRILPAEQNRTEDIVIRSQYPLLASLRMGIPAPARHLAKRLVPKLVELINRLSIRTRKVMLPTISEVEKKIVADILAEEIKYFSSVPRIGRQGD
jgi:hypothetical protein